MTDDANNGGEAKPNGKSKHGFASWDPEKRRRVASSGGIAAHAARTAHEFTPEEARAAGRKGGLAASAKLAPARAAAKQRREDAKRRNEEGDPA